MHEELIKFYFDLASQIEQTDQNQAYIVSDVINYFWEIAKNDMARNPFVKDEVKHISDKLKEAVEGKAQASAVLDDKKRIAIEKAMEAIEKVVDKNVLEKIREEHKKIKFEKLIKESFK